MEKDKKTEQPKENKVKIWWDAKGKYYAISVAKVVGGAAAVVGAGYALVKWGEHCHDKFVSEGIEKLMDVTNPDPETIKGLEGDKLLNKLVDAFNEERGVKDFIENTNTALEAIGNEAKERGIDVVISYASDNAGNLAQEIDVYKDNISLDTAVEWTSKR